MLHIVSRFIRLRSAVSFFHRTRKFLELRSISLLNEPISFLKEVKEHDEKIIEFHFGSFINGAGNSSSIGWSQTRGWTYHNYMYLYPLKAGGVSKCFFRIIEGQPFFYVNMFKEHRFHCTKLKKGRNKAEGFAILKFLRSHCLFSKQSFFPVKVNHIDWHWHNHLVHSPI